MNSNVDFKYLAPIMMHGFSNNYIVHPVVRFFVFLMLFSATLAPRVFHFRTGTFSVSLTVSLISAPFLSHVLFFTSYFTVLAIQISGFEYKIKHQLCCQFKHHQNPLPPAIDVELQILETQHLDAMEAFDSMQISETQHLDAMEAFDSIQISWETGDSSNTNWHQPQLEVAGHAASGHFASLELERVQLPSLEDEIGNLMANWV